VRAPVVFKRERERELGRAATLKMSLARTRAGDSAQKGPVTPGAGALPAVPHAAQGTKLATFDWPPPPSPATATRPGDKSGSLGASAGSPEAESEYRSLSRPAEIRARAELWALRADIEREKLRMVAPYPFFGCAMRFQDDFAALQITEDGRFSFSDVSLEAVGAADLGSEEGGGEGGLKHQKRVVTYEGVFQSQNNAFDDEVQERSDPETSSIEGIALAKHEMVELNGRSRLVTVERGEFRFTITVSPFFQPAHATVQACQRDRLGSTGGGAGPKQRRRRARRLPYVGPGGPFKTVAQGTRLNGGAASLGKKSSPLQRIKVSRSAAQLASWQSPQGKLGALPKLGNSRSAPALH